MQDQQVQSPKNLNKKNVKTNTEIIEKYTKGKTYVEYKTLRQEILKGLNKFSKHFSNEENVEAIKTNICALVDDLSSHAKTIEKTKNSGMGYAIANILLPRTVKAMNEKKNRKESNKT